MSDFLYSKSNNNAMKYKNMTMVVMRKLKSIPESTTSKLLNMTIQHFSVVLYGLQYPAITICKSCSYITFWTKLLILC